MIKTMQQTVGASFSVGGKGLHTGKVSKLTVKPAPEDSGIRFMRKDIGEDAVIEAVAENVSGTARCTTITNGSFSVVTIEHLLSALTGMGIDNAIIELDNEEVPILDGSARPYVEAIREVGTLAQSAPRRYVEVDRVIEIYDEKSGSMVRIEPADAASYDLRIDFNSSVLGIQDAHWDPSVSYADEIGICRTFVFFHEIEHLFRNNLIKGGDVDNAIVIVEHPVEKEQLDHLSKLFDVPSLARSESGYLNNLSLHFENECARHKMLDLIGDLRLVGGFLKAKVTAVKSGHSINTRAARAVRDLLLERN